LGNYIPLAENIANNGTASVTLPTSFVGTTVTFGKNFKIIVSISNSAGVGLVNNASQLFTINNFTLQSKSTADALPYWYVQCPDGTLMRASTSAPVSTLNWACDNFTPNLGGKI
jgi:hypothetical protein